MENYINLDKNMVVTTDFGDTQVAWYDVRKAPFVLHGLYKPQTEPFFHRMPDNVAEATSPSVALLQRESAGGRVRFSTNSPFIAIRAKYLAVGRSPHIPLVSNAGFDLYRDGAFGQEYVREFRMPYDMTDSYQQKIDLPDAEEHFYTVNFPIHSVVETLEIGIAPGSSLGGEKPYLDAKPIIFYGSSIVHSTACCRPGLSYENVVCRALNMDYVNLGFSGHAMGEQAIAEWMGGLDMSVFVCDYDHNAPTVEHLEATHFPMYETIRRKNPTVPYIMITRPNYWTATNGEDVLKRRDVVMASYLKARTAGDRNVYFIDGMSFFADEHMYDCIMDHVHPNDLGFVRMGDVIAANIRHILTHRV